MSVRYKVYASFTWLCTVQDCTYIAASEYTSFIYNYVLADLCLITAEHGFLYAQRLPRLWCLLAGLAESSIAGLSD